MSETNPILKLVSIVLWLYETYNILPINEYADKIIILSSNATKISGKLHVWKFFKRDNSKWYILYS